MRRRHAAALLLVALTLAAPLASAAPWLQYGYDAARTGATPDPGPETDDVAFRVALPPDDVRGLPRFPPLILDGHVYTVSTDFAGLVSRIARTSLATGEVANLVEEPIEVRSLPNDLLRGADSPAWLAWDGARLLAGGRSVLRAYDLETGERFWETEIPISTAGEPVQVNCRPAAVQGARAYLACVHAGDAFYDFRPSVVAVDLPTGSVAWTWAHDASQTVSDTIRLPAACPAPGAPTCSGGLTVPVGIALAGPNVIASFFGIGARGVIEATAFAIEAEGGGTVSRFQEVDSQAVTIRTRNCNFDDNCANTAYPVLVPSSTATGVFLGLGNSVRFFDPALESEQRRFPLQRDLRDNAFFFAEGFALSDQRVYAASAFSMHAIEGSVELPGWPIDPLAPSEYWAGHLSVAAGRTLFATTLSEDNTDALYSFDAQDGRTLWKVTFSKAVSRGTNIFGQEYAPPMEKGISYAVGDGVVAIAHRDNELIVIGRTAASIGVEVGPSTEYPDVDEPVVVDLSSTRPGVFGPATSFAADWGDGSPVEWQSSPVLAHAYNSTGDKTARFYARNDANQTASTLVTFHVGGTEPTFLENAFSAENQNATFFVLGLAGTGIGGVVGLLRLQRRRGTLERELAFLESEYARTKARPLECERMLAERKAHARSLLLDRKLEESQVSVIERRVEELTRTVRMHEIEELLDLIPRGLARALEEVLADGRITTWERRSFLHVLEDDRFLSPDAKARVRGIIDDWYARDTGRAAAGLGQGQGHGQGEGRRQGPGEGEDPGPGRRGDA